MPLGGFAPCPLPLGGTETDGLLAEQHARLATDLRALVQTAPFAVLHLNTGSSTPIAYLGQHNVGVSSAPTITVLAGGDVRVTWNVSYADEYDNVYSTNIAQAVATSATVGGNPVIVTVLIESSRSVRLTTSLIFAPGVTFPTATDSTLVVW